MSYNIVSRLVPELPEEIEANGSAVGEAAEGSTGTAEDLQVEADPEEFDRTFQATKSDVPLAVGAEVPIPRPWQGIPRVAMVFNFNYVWDDTAEEWVRDTGNSGGGLFTRVASGTITGIDDGQISVDETSVSGEDRAIFCYGRVISSGGANFELVSGSSGENLDPVAFEAGYESLSNNDRWSAVVFNNSEQTVDVEYQLLELSQP